jgi:hypothetical protein
MKVGASVGVLDGNKVDSVDDIKVGASVGMADGDNVEERV